MSPGALAAHRHSRMPESAQPKVAPVSSSPSARRRSVPATGLPVQRDDRRGWGLFSALLHALIIALLIAPIATHTGNVIERPQGAGGPGPAGGGGGGKRGTGGIQEKVKYVAVAPQPEPVVKQAVIPPPVVPPTPKPVIPPPEVVKQPDPIPDVKPAEVKAEPKAEATAPTPGTGGGTGRDGSAGSGPGSGGGVGSGIGTGRGSGVGPGTGGGNQANYAPTPIELFIPPLPMPARVKGFHLVAEYDIDETGKVVDFKFTPTSDVGYNRRLEEMLKKYEFRPGTTRDGMPIRMKAQIIYDF